MLCRPKIAGSVLFGKSGRTQKREAVSWESVSAGSIPLLSLWKRDDHCRYGNPYWVISQPALCCPSLPFAAHPVFPLGAAPSTGRGKIWLAMDVAVRKTVLEAYGPKARRPHAA